MRFLLCLLAALLLPVPAAAHDPASPQYDGWYASLMTRDGYSCCNRTDCLPTDYRLGPDGYEALIDERFPGVTSPRWERVPGDAVLARENPTGSAVACWFGGRIRCFVPQALF